MLISASSLVILMLGLAPPTAGAADYDDDYLTSAMTADEAPAGCQMPVTKAYQIKPNFCPMALVHMIPGAVGPDCCCGGCGPYGIPPLYASGQNVMVRATPETQERVKEFLTSLGALAKPKKRSY